MTLMRKRSAQDREDGFHAMRARARDHVWELMNEFRREADHGLRCWLMELIGEARSEEAFAFMCEWVDSSDESLRDWAIRGMAKLDTKSARSFLFERGVK